MAANCVRCGSDKRVPDVALTDRYGETGHLTGAVKVRVHGDPGAWFFKDTTAGALLADICGECGHVELRAENARELYEKYRKAGGQ